MFIFSLELQKHHGHSAHNASALIPDFSQHGNKRAVSQDMGNKVTEVTYLTYDIYF